MVLTKTTDLKPPILIALFLLILAVTFAVYYPGLTGTFVFDDIPNVERNTYIAIQDLKPTTLFDAAFSSASSAFGRPLSMLSFALNYYESGLNPFYFKLTNVIIHLINGASIFVLTLLLLNFYRKQWQPKLSIAHIQMVSLVVTTAWLLHPFNLTSVLYVVQRMTSLSTLFSIWGLTLFFWGRTRLHDGTGGIISMLTSVLLFTPLAILSKENGALLPIFMLAAEIALFNFRTQNIFGRRFLISFHLCFAAVPIVIALIYVSTHPQWILVGYNNRNFTLLERIMTEARVIWFYLWQIILPNISQMGLYHDDIVNSRGLFEPVTTIFSLAGILALLALSFLTRRKSPIVAFGVLFFLVGQILESTIYPLDIAYEHRNYFPMYGILLILFFYMLYPLRYVNNLHLRQIAAALFIGLFAFTTFSRANEWANPFDQFRMEVERHPHSVRSNVEMGFIYSSITPSDPNGMERYYQLSRQYYENAYRLDKNDTGGLFGLITLTSTRAKTIEPAWIDELANRLEHIPYPAITSDKILSLTNCQLEERCKLADSDIEKLLEAVLRNPTATGSNRSKVLFALSSYLINVKHDYPGALIAMHKMVESAPYDFAYRFALINFLTALRRLDEANAEIQKAGAIDAKEKHTKKLVELKLQITKIKATTSAYIK